MYIISNLEGLFTEVNYHLQQFDKFNKSHNYEYKRHLDLQYDSFVHA